MDHLRLVLKADFVAATLGIKATDVTSLAVVLLERPKG
jgi:hypothetical protein